MMVSEQREQAPDDALLIVDGLPADTWIAAIIGTREYLVADKRPGNVGCRGEEAHCSGTAMYPASARIRVRATSDARTTIPERSHKPMKPCTVCGVSKPCTAPDLAGYEHLRLCRVCSDALREGGVTVTDVDGDESAALSLRADRNVVFLGVSSSDGTITQVDLSRAETARTALRILLGMGAFNKDGDGATWPRGVPIPDALKDQRHDPPPEPLFVPLALTLEYRGRCGVCGTGVVSLTAENGWVACGVCGAEYRVTVTVLERGTTKD